MEGQNNTRFVRVEEFVDGKLAIKEQRPGVDSTAQRLGFEFIDVLKERPGEDPEGTGTTRRWAEAPGVRRTPEPKPPSQHNPPPTPPREGEAIG